MSRCKRLALFGMALSLLAISCGGAGGPVQGGASPEGTATLGRIAFASDRDGDLDIYVMNADGTDVRKLTENPAIDMFPAWSPDGTKIAFVSGVVEALLTCSCDIFAMNADGTGVKQLTDDPAEDTMPAWSPDGMKIAFISHRGPGFQHVYVMNADGTGVKPLTDPAAADTADSVLTPLAWSPDGTKIAFGREIVPRPPDVYLMNADGTDVRELTGDPVIDAWPAWSPDGTEIAFVSDRDGDADIYIMNPDGTGVRQLTDHPGNEAFPVWSTVAEAS